MIIHVKQACEFSNDNGEVYHCANGFIGIPPEWVINNRFFKVLTKAGLITAHIDNKSVDEDLAKDDNIIKDEKKKRG